MKIYIYININKEFKIIDLADSSNAIQLSNDFIVKT